MGCVFVHLSEGRYSECVRGAGGWKKECVYLRKGCVCESARAVDGGRVCVTVSLVGRKRCALLFQGRVEVLLGGHGESPGRLPSLRTLPFLPCRPAPSA